MVMVVVVLVLMLMLVVMVVVMAAGAGLVLPVVVVVSDLLHQLAGQVVAPLHGRDDLGAGELVPGGGEDSRLGVVGTQHGYVGGQLGLVLFWVRLRRIAEACSTWLLKNSPKFFI